MKYLFSSLMRAGRLLRATCFSLVLCLLPFLCQNQCCAATAENKLTILVYICGSDLETDGQSASRDIQEMTDAMPENTGVRVLVQAGGAGSWGLDIDPSKSTRMEIMSGRREIISEADACNMGQSETLTDFLIWGCQYAPADRYGLILWDHGGGPLLGVCFDEQFRDGRNEKDSLSMLELDEALANSPFGREKLAFIGFDACLMCTVEMVAMLSPYADYMIASEETITSDGWNYSFLSGLTGSESGEEIGRRIVESFRSFFRDSTSIATLALLDLSKTEALLQELDAYFLAIDNSLSADSYIRYSQCRADSKAIGGLFPSYYDLVDLADLISRFEKENVADGASLRAALDELILDFFSARDDRENGISIYYPLENKRDYVSSWYSLYQQNGFSATYRAFIGSISDYYLNRELFTWNSDYQILLQEEGGSTRVEFPMTDEERSLIVRKRLMVLEKLADDNYRLIYYNDQRAGRSQKGISAKYNGEALYVTDHDHNIIAGPISYFPVENGVSPVGLVYTVNSDGSISTTSVRLVFQWNSEGRLELSQVMMQQNASGGMFLPSSIDMKNFDEVLLLSFGPQNVVGEETVTSLQFGIYMDNSVSVNFRDDSWELALLPVWTRFERYAYIRVTDIQGETRNSAVTCLTNPGNIAVADEQPLEPDNRLDVKLNGVTLVTGYGSGLLISLKTTNRSDESLILETGDVTLGTTDINADRVQAYKYLLAPDEEEEITVFIPLETLQETNLPSEIKEGSICLLLTDGQGRHTEYRSAFSLDLAASVLNTKTE